MPHDDQDRDAGGEPWDDSTWVDVGDDDRWRPTFEERARALVVMAVVVAVLLMAAAAASMGDDDEPAAAVESTETTATTDASTTTTEPPDPASLDGEDPPPFCQDDDRNANAMRARSLSTVLVLNGTPRSGHAGETTDALEELGYSTMVPDNASIQPVTTIQYEPGFCAEADRLVKDLDIDGATYAPLPGDSEVFLGRAVLLVTLGRDSL